MYVLFNKLRFLFSFGRCLIYNGQKPTKVRTTLKYHVPPQKSSGPATAFWNIGPLKNGRYPILPLSELHKYLFVFLENHTTL